MTLIAPAAPTRMLVLAFKTSPILASLLPPTNTLGEPDAITVRLLLQGDGLDVQVIPGLLGILSVSLIGWTPLNNTFTEGVVGFIVKGEPVHGQEAPESTIPL